MKMIRLRYWLALSLLFLTTSCSGTWQFQENNDYFKTHGNEDRNYTQGIRLTNTHQDDTGTHSYYGGQNIYTPGDKQRLDYNPNDRPYAGFLYAGYDARYVRSPNVQDTFGIVVGTTGPNSFAEQAQNEVHRLIGTAVVRGWDNQLENEVGFYTLAERRYYSALNSNIDSISMIGANLGTVFTQVYSSIGIRLGVNLQPQFDTLTPIFPRGVQNRLSYYVAAEALQRAVARNMFLDGNTFRDSASIDKKPFVSEGRISLVLEYRPYIVRYTYVVQTEEFEGENSNASFGEIDFVWQF